MIESLEHRKLMSGTTLHKGVLTIHGTDSDDIITVQKSVVAEAGRHGGTLFVAHLLINIDDQAAGDFRLPDVAKVIVKLGPGDDSFIAGKKFSIPFDVSGGDGNDTLGGGRGPDVLRAGDGDNLLSGGGGNDHLFAGFDDDTLNGGAGNNTADYSGRTDDLNLSLDGQANDGAPGQDGLIENSIQTIIGGGGADTISAEGLLTSVALFGGGGNDTILSGARADTIHGGPGNDSIHGEAGNDYINGDGGKDKLFGDADNDTLNGGGPDPQFIPLPAGGADTIFGNDGSVDTLNGGSGSDTIIQDAFDIPVNIP